ncbi:hypothetical protein JM658_15690 [Joostella atrarenae]|uniref:Lipocalin-like domain-containing protein n=1 Tax=Joostella atrarenae TaxID=679257 RepID=A0ABS9J7A6_9FLAO|nr:hypothetical protein [Joostella atrarenae]MCF8716273.1 hypothetical protein [Joostella atrarenae]
MRRIFLPLIIGLLLISCSSDDDNQTISLDKQILEDSWNFQRHGEVCSEGFDLEEGAPFEFRFLADNTIEFTDPGYLTSSYYELIGNELTLETVYTLPSGSKRKFIGNYTYSESNENFTGTNSFTAYNDDEILWACEGTTSIFR